MTMIQQQQQQQQQQQVPFRRGRDSCWKFFPFFLSIVLFLTCSRRNTGCLFCDAAATAAADQTITNQDDADDDEVATANKKWEHPQQHQQPKNHQYRSNDSTLCLTTGQVQCLMERNCSEEKDDFLNNNNEIAILLHQNFLDNDGDDDDLLLSRLRFPGTASSEEKRIFKANEIKQFRRYHNLSATCSVIEKNIVGASSIMMDKGQQQQQEQQQEQQEQKLCFTPSSSHDNNNNEVSGDNTLEQEIALAFRHVSLSNSFHGHIPYNEVVHIMKQETRKKKLKQHQQQQQRSNGHGSNNKKKTMNLLVTTLRDVSSYAVKWYKFRNSWDSAFATVAVSSSNSSSSLSSSSFPYLTNATLLQYIDRAPWRSNILTRMLANNNANPRSVNNGKQNMILFRDQLLHTQNPRGSSNELNLDATATFTGDDDEDDSASILEQVQKQLEEEDAYMQQQNQLGPEKSQVYQAALQRFLQNDTTNNDDYSSSMMMFTHFGLFHRLDDSWELLAHRFCWNMENHVGIRPLSSNHLRGVDAILEELQRQQQQQSHDNYINSGNKNKKNQQEEQQELLRHEAYDIWSRLMEKNQLDVALLEVAEEIMDKRVKEMRAEKANGVLCNFLGRVKVTCNDDEHHHHPHHVVNNNNNNNKSSTNNKTKTKTTTTVATVHTSKDDDDVVHSSFMEKEL